MIIMQFLVKIATALLPVLINFLGKHQDEILEKIYVKLEKVLGMSSNNIARFHIKDIEGNEISLASLVFNYDILGEIYKQVTEGKISVSGLTTGSYTFTIKADGFKDKTFTIEFNDTNTVEDVTLILERE